MIFSQRAHLATEKIFDFFNGSPWGKPLNPKSKNTVIREKHFWFWSYLSLVDTRFVLLFLEFTKKILASVYERLNESSIIPPLENRF